MNYFEFVLVSVDSLKVKIFYRLWVTSDEIITSELWTFSLQMFAIATMWKCAKHANGRKHLSCAILISSSDEIDAIIDRNEFRELNVTQYAVWRKSNRKSFVFDLFFSLWSLWKSALWHKLKISHLIRFQCSGCALYMYTDTANYAFDAE